MPVMSEMGVPETSGDTYPKMKINKVSPKRSGDTRGHRGHLPKSPTNVRNARPRSVPGAGARIGVAVGVPESVSPSVGGHTGHPRPATGQKR